MIWYISISFSNFTLTLRLPHTWEWQWIAQGDNGWKWPWGTEKPDDSLMPIFSNGRVMPPPDDVDLHPLVLKFVSYSKILVIQ